MPEAENLAGLRSDPGPPATDCRAMNFEREIVPEHVLRCSEALEWRNLKRGDRCFRRKRIGKSGLRTGALTVIVRAVQHRFTAIAGEPIC